ncbi:MAG: hypothetical protein AB8H47_29340 [Bacteroidia bacterium]
MLSSPTEYDFISQDKKISKSFDKVQSLISELNGHDIPPETEAVIQLEIDKINNAPQEFKAYRKVLRKAYAQITTSVRKDMGLVPKNYYMILGMTLGMAVFGVPMGMAFGIALGNIGLMSIGLPIGMGAGLAIGAAWDAKLAQEGKQLSIEN